MKLITFSIISLFVFLFSSFENGKKAFDNADEIAWSESSKLTWDDFKGIPDTSKVYVWAETTYKIQITDLILEKEVPKYKVRCYFIKSASWTITDDKLSLMHEQLHFDIAELYARKIRKKFESLNAQKCTDLDKYHNVYETYGKELESFQNLYDNSVYFKDNELGKWIKQNSLELIRLNKYKFTE